MDFILRVMVFVLKLMDLKEFLRMMARKTSEASTVSLWLAIPTITWLDRGVDREIACGVQGGGGGLADLVGKVAAYKQALDNRDFEAIEKIMRESKTESEGEGKGEGEPH